MDWSISTYLLLPVGLGLLGFVEPCTIGAHLVFVGSLEGRSQAARILAALTFTAVRTATLGLIGVLVALLGQLLIGAQTAIWLIFGAAYLALGLVYLLGAAGSLGLRATLAPERWRLAHSPSLLGVGFALNVPACAAPILFALIGPTASASTVLAGFSAMGLFGLALSVPLIAIAAVPRLAAWLAKVRRGGRGIRLALGAAFLLLGLWSIWFGLYVDPANWAKL